MITDSVRRLTLVIAATAVLGLLARRIGSQSRDESLILDPAELHRLREQAQARRAAATGGGEPPAA